MATPKPPERRRLLEDAELPGRAWFTPESQERALTQRNAELRRAVVVSAAAYRAPTLIASEDAEVQGLILRLEGIEQALERLCGDSARHAGLIDDCEQLRDELRATIAALIHRVDEPS